MSEICRNSKRKLKFIKKAETGGKDEMKCAGHTTFGKEFRKIVKY